MNAQVEFPFRLHSTLFCRFRVRRRFCFVAFAFNKTLAQRFFCFIVSPFCCVCIPFRCVCIPFRSVAFRGVCVASQQVHVFVQYFLRLLLSFKAKRSLPFCERVRVAQVYRLFFVRLSAFRKFVVRFLWICRPFFVDLSSVFREFVVRFSPVLQAFTICTLYVQRSFCAGVCAERKWERNFLIKGVAFSCTRSGGAPRFCALARTLK